MQFCFTVDDNIRFLRELSAGNFASMWEHPYPAMYRRLHARYGVRVQLNLFWEDPEFDLSRMTERFRAEWEACADWLRLSFHSRLENVCPYCDSGYDEVFEDCAAVHREILRFAGENSLGQTTTVHYCRTTAEGLRALTDNGVRGLLGLYGTADAPRLSYQTTEEDGNVIRQGGLVSDGAFTYGGIDVILNERKMEQILPTLQGLVGRETVKLMIHEQYFYPDYGRYQPDFEQKLATAFGYLCENGYTPAFFEDWLT